MSLSKEKKIGFFSDFSSISMIIKSYLLCLVTQVWVIQMMIELYTVVMVSERSLLIFAFAPW